MVIELDGTTIILAAIGAIVTILTAYIAKTTKEVHTAVNTNYQKMQNDLTTVTKQLADLSLANATLLEQVRGTDLATARAQGVAEAQAQSSSMPTPAPVHTQPINIVAPKVEIAAPPNDPDIDRKL